METCEIHSTCLEDKNTELTLVPPITIFIILFSFLNSSWLLSQGTSNWLRSQRQISALILVFKGGPHSAPKRRRRCRSPPRQDCKNPHWEGLRGPTCTELRSIPFQVTSGPSPTPRSLGRLSEELHSKATSFPSSATQTKSE